LISRPYLPGEQYATWISSRHLLSREVKAACPDHYFWIALSFTTCGNLSWRVTKLERSFLGELKLASREGSFRSASSLSSVRLLLRVSAWKASVCWIVTVAIALHIMHLLMENGNSSLKGLRPDKTAPYRKGGHHQTWQDGITLRVSAWKSKRLLDSDCSNCYAYNASLNGKWQLIS